MKRIMTLSSVAALLLLQGACIVRSVHPWFTASDAVFENDLIGGWIGNDPGGTEVAMTFVRGEGNSYVVQYSSKSDRGSFKAKLGKVGGEYYLDFRPADDSPGVDGLLKFPSHSVAQLEFTSDRLAVRLLNYDALKDIAKNDRMRDLKFLWEEEDPDAYLIVSETEQVRQFLMAHSQDRAVFQEPIRLSRRK